MNLHAEPSTVRSRDFRLVMGIFVAALLLRLIAAGAFEAYKIESDWHFGYETGRIASSLASGEGFSSPFSEPTGPTAWLAPGYPWLLSLVFRMFGVYSVSSAIAILMLNSVFSSAICVAAYYLGRTLFGRPTGIGTAAVLVLYPPSIWHAINTIWDTSLFALLTLMALIGLCRMTEDRGGVEVFFWGMLIGVGALVNPALLLILPILWLFLVAAPRRRSVPNTLNAVFLTIVAFALVVPWMMRNNSALERPVLRSNFGFELHLGNNEEIWGYHLRGEDVAPWFLGHPSVLASELKKFQTVGEMAYVDAAKVKALDFIQSNPAKFLRLSLRRMETFWLSDLRHRNDWSGNLKVLGPVSLVKKACHILPLPFALMGLIFAVRKGLKIGPLVTYLLLFPMLYYVTHVSERYRYPIEPLILLFGVFGAVTLWRYLRAKPQTDAVSP